MTVLVDTNVLSELLRPQPEPAVLAWFAGQNADSVCVSTVTQAEMLLGVQLLAPGKRRQTLERAMKALFAEEFAGRILTFDSGAAEAYATIVVERRRRGRPISQFDAQIAAIAHSRRASLATRNVADFRDCGLVLIDPWAAA